MAFLAASLIAWLVGGNYLLHRDVMYPGFLQAALWFAAFSLLSMTAGMFVPVSDRTLLILVVGVVLFSMGSFVGSYGHRPHLARNYLQEGTLPSKGAIGLLAAVAIVGLVLYARRAQDLAAAGPSDQPFINLRYAVSIVPDETGGFGITQYFLGPAYVLAAVAVLKKHGSSTPTIPRVVVGVTLLIGFAFGVLSSGRGPVLALIVMVLAIPTVLRARTPIRTAGTLIAMSLVLFAIVRCRPELHPIRCCCPTCARLQSHRCAGRAAVRRRSDVIERLHGPSPLYQGFRDPRWGDGAVRPRISPRGLVSTGYDSQSSCHQCLFVRDLLVSTRHAGLSRHVFHSVVDVDPIWNLRRAVLRRFQRAALPSAVHQPTTA